MVFFDSRNVDGKLRIFVQLSVLWEPGSSQPVTCFLRLDFLSENVLRLSCSSGTELPLLPFLLCCLENCCSETDRWCLCHSRHSLRYLCQLIFPPCLAVACETGPHRSNLINGVPSLRLVLAPPSSSKRKKMKTHSWIFSSFLLLFFFFK